MKTRAEKIAYTVKHLDNRMTEDLAGRRDLLVALLACQLTGDCETREESLTVLAAIDAILAKREAAR